MFAVVTFFNVMTLKYNSFYFPGTNKIINFAEIN